MMYFFHLLQHTVALVEATRTLWAVSALSEFASHVQNGLYFNANSIAVWLAQTSSITLQPNTFYRIEMAGWWLFLISSVGYIASRVKWLDLQKQIHRYTLYDPLTELPNRSLFESTLETQIRNSKKTNKKFALIVADVDHFKQINDTLNHHAGNILLQQIASRLKGGMRDTDLLARLGGDEFAFLFCNLDHESVVEQIIQRITKAMDTPIAVDGLLFTPSLSMGVVIYPENGNDVDTLLRRADVSLYQAKERRNCYVLYDEKTDEHNRKVIQLQNDLRDAIKQQAIEVYYQPKVDCIRKQIKGFEALARWRHPEFGFISPAEFIPMAKKNGLIAELTQVVLHKSIQQVSELYHQGIDISLSVNITEENLEDIQFPEQLMRILKKFDLPPHSLELEITEDVFIDKLKNAVVVTEHLKSLGIQISLDDFGTGLSSISHLKKLPISTLKIDMSFVQGIHQNADDEAIVRTTILLSKSLGLTVVAEGVEDEQTLNTLNSWDCDLIQGYYICKPVSFNDLLHWLKNTKWKPVLMPSKSSKILPFKREQTGS